MYNRANVAIWAFIVLLFTGCYSSYPSSCGVDDAQDFDVYISDEDDCICPMDDEDISESEEVVFPQPDIQASKCPKRGLCQPRELPNVTAGGSSICPPRLRCSDTRLPPQPCAQPVPAYYGDVSQDTLAEGIVLIHPVTRTQVLCYDRECESAVDCANDFRAKGYVLITDLPQQPAKYDFLRKGTYPTRKWRNGGETAPRW